MKLDWDVTTDEAVDTWASTYMGMTMILVVDMAAPEMQVTWSVEGTTLLHGISSNVFDAQTAAIIAIREFWAAFEM